MFSEDSSAGLVALNQQGSTSTSLTQTVKALCYRVILLHQASILRSKARPSLKVYLQLVFTVITTLEFLSVLTQYLESTEDFPRLKYIQQALLGVRPDIWVVSAQQGGMTLVALVVILGLIVGEITLEFLLSLFKPSIKIPKYLLVLVDFPLVIIRKYVVIPFFILIFRAIHIGFFPDSSESSQLAGAWTGAMGLICLLGYSLLTFLHTTLVHDNSWFIHSHRLLSHPNSTYELKEYVTFGLLSLIATLDISPILACFISTVLTMYLLITLIWYLPYYNERTMVVKCWEVGTCVWSGVSAFIGVIADSILTTVILFLFVTPCLGLLIAYLLNWRINKATYKPENQPFWKYELGIRKKFERHEEDAGLKEALAVGAKIYSTTTKSFFLLYAHYYYYVLDDPEIALVRLTSSAQCPGSFFSEFHIYHLSHALSSLSRSEEREFVDYQSLYRNARGLDCSLCEMTYDLLNTVINRNANEFHLERAFLNLANIIQKTQMEYRYLKSKFGNDPFVLLSYGSFLGDIFYETVAQEMITRGYFELNRRKKAHINTIESYSSVDTGVMIVSCHRQMFGKIIYVNDPMGKILGMKTGEVMGKDLDDFIPPPFNFQHNRKLSHFLACGEAKEIFRSHLFLSSNQRYSVEVTFRFRPTVVQETPYFVVAVRAKPNTREFALFDQSLIITSHSKAFAGALSLTSKPTLTGESLSTLLPGITDYMDLQQPFLYTHPTRNLTLGLKFASVSLGSGTIHWLYIIKSERGIEDLFTSVAGEEIAKFKRYLRDSTGITFDSKPYDTDSSDGTIRKTASVSNIDALAREPSTIAVITKDEGTTTTNVLTSYAKSSPGTSIRKQCVRAVTTFKFAYVGMILLTAVFITIALAVLYVTLQELSESNAGMDLGTSRLHMLKITHLARRLNLMQSGYESLTNKDTLQKQLSTEISSLNSVMENYLKNSQSPVSLFTRIGNRYIYQNLPLITALTDYNTHAQFIVNNPSLPDQSTDFFYVYYNGIGNLMHILNRTIDQHLVDMRSAGVEIIEITCSIAFIVIGVVLVLGHICVLKSLFDLERCYGKLWTTILNLPLVSAREIMNIHKDRIEVAHGCEFYPLEQSKVKENHSILQPPKRRCFLLVKVSLFAIGSIAFIMAVLITGRYAIRVLLGANNEYLDSVAYSAIMPTLTLHLAKEQYLCTHSPSSYFSIIQEGQHISNISSELRVFLGDMSELRQRILSNMIEITASSSEGLFPDFGLPFGSACNSVNMTSDCADTALAKGQHAAVAELKLRLADISHRMDSLQWSELISLENYIDQVTESTLQLLQLTQTYASASSQQFTSNMLTYSCIYLLGSGLMYTFIYLPTIATQRRHCISLWRITTLIRNDFISHK